MITDIDLATLSAADFAPGVSVTVSTGEEVSEIALEVVEVSAVGQAERAGGAFSVLMRGPADTLIEQGTYRVVIGDLGAAPLFLVPIGRESGSDALLYEALFA
ncbi:MAG: hypothetical protein AAF371_05430 [Pseudomonadota bacterium]